MRLEEISHLRYATSLQLTSILIGCTGESDSVEILNMTVTVGGPFNTQCIYESFLYLVHKNSKSGGHGEEGK